MSIGAWLRTHSTLRLAAAGLVATVVAAQAAIAAEALVRARLGDDLFHAPTRFYARPVVIAPGAVLERDRFERTLDRLGYRRARRLPVGAGEYDLGYRTWTVGRRSFRVGGQVDPGGVTRIRVGYDGWVSRIEDSNGDRLSSVSLEPELLALAHGASLQDRTPIRLSEVPQHLVDAVLAIEDRRFFDHPGFDVRRIAAAAVANVRAQRVVEGASTLTQQLAKNLYLSPRRSPIRKLRELAMAVTLERRHSKEEILQAYLNQIYLGQDGAFAIHGVGRAAQFYFDKDVSRVDLSEAALLAGIIRGPSLYSPSRHPEQAIERRNLVLDIMREREVISTDAHRRALRTPLRVTEPHDRSRSGGYSVDFVTEELRARIGDGPVDRGFSVFTTIDMEYQRAAARAVREGLERLEADYPRVRRESSPLQAALVALNPKTGEILAMVGGRDYGQSQFNRAVKARRQPGSAFKPIVALAALARDRDDSEVAFTLASTLQDEPLSVKTPAGLWEPDNYDQQFRGDVTLRDALERSLNVPFARLGMSVGPERIVETARRLGIEGNLTPVPSLALGASEVTPLELTRAFGVIAAGGLRADLHGTLGVLDAAGNAVPGAAHRGEQAYDPAEAYLITSALRGAVERGTGRSLRRLGYHGPVAAKSGTTNDFRDAWFIGYTPTVTVGVWVGFDDGRSIGLSGSRAALPIFARFLVAALGRYGEDAEFARPQGVEIVEVDHETGKRGGPGCWGEPEVFLRGTAPVESCSPYWASSRRYRDSGSRWYERVVEPLYDELRRRLGGRR